MVNAICSRVRIHRVRADNYTVSKHQQISRKSCAEDEKEKRVGTEGERCRGRAMGARATEIASKPFQHSKACIATNSTLVQPFILAGGASLSRAASLVYHRRHIAEGDGLVGETRKRETPRRRGRNAITAALNLFEVHCATGGGVNGNATSSTSTDLPLVLLPSCSRVTASTTLFLFVSLLPLSLASPRTRTIPSGYGVAGE